MIKKEFIDNCINYNIYNMLTSKQKRDMLTFDQVNISSSRTLKNIEYQFRKFHRRFLSKIPCEKKSKGRKVSNNNHIDYSNIKLEYRKVNGHIVILYDYELSKDYYKIGTIDKVLSKLRSENDNECFKLSIHKLKMKLPNDVIYRINEFI